MTSVCELTVKATNYHLYACLIFDKIYLVKHLFTLICSNYPT